MKCKNVVCGETTISCVFQNPQGGMEWVFTGCILGVITLRKMCCGGSWLNARRDDNWVVGGDFNIVLRRNERSGKNNSITWANEFKDVLEELELVDLPLVGSRWTWTNPRSTPSCSWIDLFLILHCFLSQLVDICKKLLQRTILITFLYA